DELLGRGGVLQNAVRQEWRKHWSYLGRVDIHEGAIYGLYFLCQLASEAAMRQKNLVGRRPGRQAPFGIALLVLAAAGAAPAGHVEVVGAGRQVIHVKWLRSLERRRRVRPRGTRASRCTRGHRLFRVLHVASAR